MNININTDSIIRNLDIEKLVLEAITAKILEYMDNEDMVGRALEDEKLMEFVNKRVKDIIDTFLSTEDGKNCVIQLFKERVVEEDVLIDDQITEIVAEFLKRSLEKIQ